jgi:uncharacterized RDD family membrane protein YckC
VSIAARRSGMTEAARAPAGAAADEHGAAVAVAAQPYVGLVTRAIAFAIDAALINVVAILTAAVAALIFSIVSIPDQLRPVAVATGGALYLLWAVGYFVAFWSTTGQTPGNRVLRIRVRAASGGTLRPRRALLRFIGLSLAALPLCAGFLLILVDDRRRGLHDRLAGTVVTEAEPDSPAQRSRTGHSRAANE